MKFNLKNRPKIDKKKAKSLELYMAISIEEWFEGFQKELQQMYKSVDDVKDNEDSGRFFLIQEILGYEFN